MKQVHLQRFIFVIVLWGLTSADIERPISVSDTGEGTKCDADLDIAKLCLACSRLPGDIAVQLTDCCAEEKARNFCDICVMNPDACLSETYNIADNKGNDLSGQAQDMDKRWGRMFFGGGGLGYPRGVGKRYGRVFFGKRPGGFLYGPSKREDENFGNYNEGYISDGDDDNYLSDMDKRYGRLFTSGKFGMYNKRFGSLFFGKSRPRSRIWD